MTPLWVRLLPWRWIGAALAVLAVLAGYFEAGRRFERPRAFRAGQLAQDKVWNDAAKLAKARQEAEARATEARQAQSGKQEGKRYEAERVELRAGYRAARARWVRDKATSGSGAARNGDLSGTAGGPAGVDAACRAKLDAVTVAVLNRSEEGDGYRAQVIAWQAWARAVGVAPPG
jgi:hypothetical protein